jgi:hypothetical protein
MRSRTATAVVGLLVSLAVSVGVYYATGSLLVFLVVPFVPFLFRRGRDGSGSPAGECPVCGFHSRSEEYEYCPRDGRRLK